MVATNDYHFITQWRVRGSIEDVSAVLSDAPALTRWWPAVYLEVRQRTPGEALGVDGVVDLYTKGWLPYTLRWSFRVSESHPPHGFTIEAFGDFVGRGIWTLRQDGAWAAITYDWKIRADKGLLRRGSLIFKPIFAANHRWAMATGEKSLVLELARRHAATAEERARIPAPPKATTTSTLPMLAGTAATLVLAIAVWRILSH